MRGITPTVPDRLWIGMDYATKQVDPTLGIAEFKVTVPTTDRKELQLRVECATDFNAEVSYHPWMTFVYTRNP